MADPADPNEPTARFSTRVDNYVRYRPGYPPALIPLLENAGTLCPGDRVADLGAGTGLLTRRFLDAGYDVTPLEPNAPMREAGERLLGRSFAATTAEATGFDDRSIDLIVVAQAFHWFDLEPTVAEFRRILAPKGRVALIWNVRDEENDPFMRDYEALLAEHGTDYRNVGAHGADAAARQAIFGRSEGAFDRLPNEQPLDFDGLLGRLLSASYAPEEGTPGYAPMVEALRALYDRYADDDGIKLRYRTEIYHGAAVL